jgi:hypothetical protein
MIAAESFEFEGEQFVQLTSDTGSIMTCTEAEYVQFAGRDMTDDAQHVIDLRVDGWTIKHPLTCRPNLFNCPANSAARGLADSPAVPGRYVCELDDTGQLVIGPPAGPESYSEPNS